MPQRRIHTGIWTDPWFQKLSMERRYLFIYLWSNDHCNQAGFYQITLETLAFETQLPLEEIPRLLKSLEPKIKWFPEENLIWIKNFIRHQASNPSFYEAACKCVKALDNNGHLNLLEEFNNYNKKGTVCYHSVTTVVTPSNTNTNTNTKEGGSRGEPTLRRRPRGENIERIPLDHIGKTPGEILGQIKKGIEERQKKRAKKK